MPDVVTIHLGYLELLGRKPDSIYCRLAGHASPATTAIYTAVDQADAAAVVEQLPIPRHLKAVCNDI